MKCLDVIVSSHRCRQIRLFEKREQFVIRYDATEILDSLLHGRFRNTRNVV